VYIDSETGAVIGGSAGRRAGLIMPGAPARLDDALLHAREVRLYAQAKPGIWSPQSAGKLNANLHADQFAAVTRTPLLVAVPPRTFADCKVILVSEKGQTTEVSYWSSQGVLSCDGAHRALPDSFKRWALTALRTHEVR